MMASPGGFGMDKPFRSLLYDAEDDEKQIRQVGKPARDDWEDEDVPEKAQQSEGRQISYGPDVSEGFRSHAQDTQTNAQAIVEKIKLSRPQMTQAGMEPQPGNRDSSTGRFVDAAALAALQSDQSPVSVGNFSWLKKSRSKKTADNTKAAAPSSASMRPIVIGFAISSDSDVAISPQAAMVETPAVLSSFPQNRPKPMAARLTDCTAEGNMRGGGSAQGGSRDHAFSPMPVDKSTRREVQEREWWEDVDEKKGMAQAQTPGFSQTSATSFSVHTATRAPTMALQPTVQAFLMSAPLETQSERAGIMAAENEMERPPPYSPPEKLTMHSKASGRTHGAETTHGSVEAARDAVLPDRPAGTFLPDGHNVPIGRGVYSNTERERRRHEKEDVWARRLNRVWKGRACGRLPGQNYFGRTGREGRKRRRVLLGVCGALIALVAAGTILAVVFGRREMKAAAAQPTGPQPDPEGRWQWANLTNWPPIPTGVVKILGPENTKADSSCVQPQSLWSCDLAPEAAEQNAPFAANQPRFVMQIQYKPVNMDAVSGLPQAQDTDPPSWTTPPVVVVTATDSGARIGSTPASTSIGTSTTMTTGTTTGMTTGTTTTRITSTISGERVIPTQQILNNQTGSNPNLTDGLGFLPGHDRLLEMRHISNKIVATLSGLLFPRQQLQKRVVMKTFPQPMLPQEYSFLNQYTDKTDGGIYGEESPFWISIIDSADHTVGPNNLSLADVGVAVRDIADSISAVLDGGQPPEPSATSNAGPRASLAGTFATLVLDGPPLKLPTSSAGTSAQFATSPAAKNTPALPVEDDPDSPRYRPRKNNTVYDFNLAPTPETKRDGTAAPGRLLPLARQQNLRLYGRGRPTEHYAFYIYFNRSMYVSSADQADARDVTPSDAKNLVIWAQTRYKVEIWTRTLGDEARLPDGLLLGANARGVPGTMPLPVTVTLDLHGGQPERKATVVYNVTRGVVDMDRRGWREKVVDIGSGGFDVVNDRKAEKGYELAWGGVDGGEGGCACEWKNWKALQ